MEINIPYYEDNTRISNSSLGWFKISPKYFYEKLKGSAEWVHFFRRQRLPETP